MYKPVAIALRGVAFYNNFPFQGSDTIKGHYLVHIEPVTLNRYSNFLTQKFSQCEINMQIIVKQ